MHRSGPVDVIHANPCHDPTISESGSMDPHNRNNSDTEMEMAQHGDTVEVRHFDKQAPGAPGKCHLCAIASKHWMACSRNQRL
uniref:Uncharacterized protein n=1 Tax=Panagrellus redivivus TaxID=6233 RepID=A0A7E4WA90_PANRE